MRQHKQIWSVYRFSVIEKRFREQAVAGRAREFCCARSGHRGVPLRFQQSNHAMRPPQTFRLVLEKVEPARQATGFLKKFTASSS